MNTVLVTGGAGYVGSMLTRELLSHGHEVIVADSLLFGGESLVDLLSLPAFSFSRTDITRSEELARLFSAHRFDAVVHLASIVGDPACKAQPNWLSTPSGTDPKTSSSCANDMSAAFRLCIDLQQLREDGGRHVATRSSPTPVSLYAELKVQFERTSRGVGTEWLHHTAVRDRLWTLLAATFRLDRQRIRPRRLAQGGVEIYGPQFWRPYCHVRDTPRAGRMVLEAELERVAGKTFNVGSNEKNYQKQMIADEVGAADPAEIRYVQKDRRPRDYR